MALSGGPTDLNGVGLDALVEIGRGGFGTVYRAFEPALNRVVAVKVLSIEGWDDAQRARFVRELQALGAAEHPNIVTVYRGGVTDLGRTYIVMEYLEGGSLAAALRKSGPMPWQKAADIGVKLACALDFAHVRGILHRDIKPENVLLSAFSEPKLADFGIAHIAGQPATRTGISTLSVAHAPPEVFDGQDSTPASDVYSLSSTICTVASGQPPFVKSPGDTLFAVMARIREEQPPDLRQFGLPAPLAATLERALAKDPSARPQTALAFAEELQRAQVASGVPATPLVITRTVIPLPPSGPDDGDATVLPIATVYMPPPPPPSDIAPGLDTAPDQSPEPTKGGRRRLVAGIVAAALIILVAGSVGAYALLGSSKPSHSLAVAAATSPAQTVLPTTQPSLTPAPTPTPLAPTLTPNAAPAPSPTAGPVTYLMNLGWSTGSDAPSNRGVDTMNGKTFNYSLIYNGSYQTYNTIYALEASYSEFTATLGLADHLASSCDNSGTAVFQVQIDGITEKTITVPQGHNDVIELPVSGAQQLQLTTIGSDGNCDAVWGNAALAP